MISSFSARWKALPLKRRLVLALLFETASLALIFLLFAVPEAGGEVPMGGITAVTLLLMSGDRLAVFVPKWMPSAVGETSGTPAQSTKRRSLAKRVFGAALVLFLAGYLLVITFPQPLFPYSLTHRGFTVHSDQPMPTSIYSVLDRTAARLAASAVYDSTAHHTIFLAGSYPKFALFAREHFRAFGIRSPIRGHIFISKADPERDVVVRFGADHNERRLSGVIAQRPSIVCWRRRRVAVTCRGGRRRDMRSM